MKSLSFLVIFLCFGIAEGQEPGIEVQTGQWNNPLYIATPTTPFNITVKDFSSLQITGVNGAVMLSCKGSEDNVSDCKIAENHTLDEVIRAVVSTIKTDGDRQQKALDVERARSQALYDIAVNLLKANRAATLLRRPTNKSKIKGCVKSKSPCLVK